MQKDRFGVRLKAARVFRHMTQVELAEKLGITQGYLSGIESGRCANFTVQLLARINQVLDMPLSMASLQTIQALVESGTSLAAALKDPIFVEVARKLADAYMKKPYLLEMVDHLCSK